MEQGEASVHGTHPPPPLLSASLGRPGQVQHSSRRLTSSVLHPPHPLEGELRLLVQVPRALAPEVVEDRLKPHAPGPTRGRLG